jgi:hypothetical protein
MAASVTPTPMKLSPPLSATQVGLMSWPVPTNSKRATVSHNALAFPPVVTTTKNDPSAETSTPRM